MALNIAGSMETPSADLLNTPFSLAKVTPLGFEVQPRPLHRSSPGLPPGSDYAPPKLFYYEMII